MISKTPTNTWKLCGEACWTIFTFKKVPSSLQQLAGIDKVSSVRRCRCYCTPEHKMQRLVGTFLESHFDWIVITGFSVFRSFRTRRGGGGFNNMVDFSSEIIVIQSLWVKFEVNEGLVAENRMNLFLYNA